MGWGLEREENAVLPGSGKEHAVEFHSSFRESDRPVLAWRVPQSPPDPLSGGLRGCDREDYVVFGQRCLTGGKARGRSDGVTEGDVRGMARMPYADTETCFPPVFSLV